MVGVQTIAIIKSFKKRGQEIGLMPVHLHLEAHLQACSFKVEVQVFTISGSRLTGSKTSDLFIVTL